MKDWKIFEGNGKPGRSKKGLLVENLPRPPWRDFAKRDQLEAILLRELEER